MCLIVFRKELIDYGRISFDAVDLCKIQALRERTSADARATIRSGL
jgi:hypothetical protein